VSDKPSTRPYVAKVFGQTFAVDCATPGQVSTHLVNRLRAEIEIRKATFEDGIEAERLGIEIEYYGEEQTPDLFGNEPGSTPIGTDE